MNSTRRGKIFVNVAALTFVATLYGCPVHDGATGGATTPGGGGGGLALVGTTTLGPISGANITVFLANPDGSNGKQIGSGHTNNDGTFNITLTEKPTGSFRVCSGNGNYTDESTGTPKTNNVTNFCALVPVGTGEANITPLTAFIDSLAKGGLKKKTNPTPTDLTNAVTQAQQSIQKFFGLKKAPHQIKPVFTPPATGTPGDDYALGALLGAFSQLEADNGARCGGTVAQNRLNALIADISDGVFDGKTLNPLNAAQTIAVEVACANATGGKEPLPLGTGTAELLTAFDHFAQTDFGKNTMHLDQQPAVRDEVRTAVATGDLAPPQVNVVASQGLIAIDTASKIAYAPIYTWDANGNARIAVIDLTPGVAHPVLGTISLPGSQQPVASSFDPVGHRVYVEARRNANGQDDGINVYVIDPSTRTVLKTIDAKGMSHNGTFGGIVADPGRKHVVVVGTNDLGYIDISTDPATFDENSVISLFGTDSIALNLTTGILFNSDDGSNQLVDTSKNPATLISFPAAGGTTDGVAFDNLTNVVAQSVEVGSDITHVFNFNDLLISNGAGNAPFVSIPGNGNGPTTGEGPGGQAAVNVLTHQAVAIDEFGENFKLLQLPLATFTGTPTNTQTGAGAAYQISAGVIPKADLSGENGSAQTQLTMRGDPNSLSINPVSNRMYALADTSTGYNTWPANDTRPLFLVEVDLSQPVQGASPTATTQQGQPLRWNPASRLIRLP